MQCTSAAACKHLGYQRIFRWGIGRRKCRLQKKAPQHGPKSRLFSASRWFSTLAKIRILPSSGLQLERDESVSPLPCLPFFAEAPLSLVVHLVPFSLPSAFRLSLDSRYGFSWYPNLYLMPADLLINQTVLIPKVHGHNSRVLPVEIAHMSPPTHSDAGCQSAN
jgi:hypothetical protein